jgi:hypothetical protein
MYRDSVGNVYRTLPSRKPNGGAKSTSNKTSKRASNAHRKQKFAAQFARTEANKARRAARRKRWLAARRAKRTIALPEAA